MYRMNYVIAIPSYNRATQCNQKTLKCLHEANIPKHLINVFVVEEEFSVYKNILNPEYYNELVIGHKGLVPQREFIESYYPANAHIVSLDDDIESVDLSLTDYKTVHEFIVSAFETCADKKSFIWGVYPCFNPFFRKDKVDVSDGLQFIIASFYGFVNRPKDDDLKLKLTRHGNKDDVERSILYWLKDGITIRFNRIGFKTKMYSKGGLGQLPERLEIMKNDSLALQAKYPSITRIKIRKNGLYEIVLKSPKTSPTELQSKPYHLDEIDPSSELLQKVFQLLNETTIPMNSNKLGRARTFKKSYRGCVLGYITARNTRIFGLSYYSKRYPELYNAIVEFGKTFVPFEFNAIQLNHNVECPRHLDPYNTGDSCIVSFGNYEGCNLVIENFGEYNTCARPLVFNGSVNYHFNTPLISGNKYSLVYFKQLPK